VKGKSAVVAKILFELRAKIRDGSADAACPAVLSTEVLPYGGPAKVWIFGVQFGLRPRGEAHSWGPWRSQPFGINGLGQPVLLFEPLRHSPPLKVFLFVLLPARGMNFSPAVQMYGWTLLPCDREPTLNTDQFECESLPASKDLD